MNKRAFKSLQEDCYLNFILQNTTLGLILNELLLEKIVK